MYDPWFFYRKHLLRNLPEKDKTDSMVIGSAVDMWLTQGYEKFIANFQVMGRRSTKSDIPHEYQLNPTMLETIAGICEEVTRHEVYKDIMANFTSQDVLYIDKPSGEFAGICGIPDWYHHAEGGVCTIVDLKTTSNLDAKKYYYHCLDFNYYDQQAIYRVLLKNKYPDIKEFRSYHLVVETGDYKRTELYRLNDDTIDIKMSEVWLKYEKITNQKYAEPNLKWETAKEL